MSDFSWLKDNGALVTAIAALAVSLLSLWGSYASNRQKAALDRRARQEILAEQEAQRARDAERSCLIACDKALQSFRFALRKLQMGAQQEGVLSAKSICGELDGAVEALGNAYAHLKAQVPKKHFPATHEFRTSALRLANKVRSEIGKQEYVPRFNDELDRCIGNSFSYLDDCAREIAEERSNIEYHSIAKAF